MNYSKKKETSSANSESAQNLANDGVFFLSIFANAQFDHTVAFEIRNAWDQRHSEMSYCMHGVCKISLIRMSCVWNKGSICQIRTIERIMAYEEPTSYFKKR